MSSESRGGRTASSLVILLFAATDINKPSTAEINDPGQKIGEREAYLLISPSAVFLEVLTKGYLKQNCVK